MTEIDGQNAGTPRETREVNGTTVYKRENGHGVPKDHVKVEMGETSVVECRRRVRNPLTDRREDLTRLSDDGYLKPFLALHYVANKQDTVDLSNAPILTFDPDRWEWEEQDGSLVVQKSEPESRYGEMVIGDE